jgi:hypothetical protein
MFNILELTDLYDLKVIPYIRSSISVSEDEITLASFSPCSTTFSMSLYLCREPVRQAPADRLQYRITVPFRDISGTDGHYTG